MPTNLNINDSLLEKAVEIGNHKSKKEAVNTALDEYINRKSQSKIIELFGTIDIDDNYDYEKGRK